MHLKNKNILLISPEPWDHIFVSKHHYATHLAKIGNRVFFQGPPSGHYSVEKTDFENVFTLGYPGFLKGLRFYPEFLQKYFTRKQFDQLQKLCKVKFEIVWSFDNSVFFDFSAVPQDVLKISHIVDLNQDFQIRKAASTADYCFCTTELIKERLLKYNSRVFKINHGFNNHVVDNSIVTFPGKSKIKALYAGNLAIPFIDWALLHQVVKENPGVDFIFVGPNAELFTQDSEQNKQKKNVLSSDNTYFIGKVNSNELIQYERSADILIVAYQEKHHKDQANPHKMMEYFGSGKMIVATDTTEYQDLVQKGLFLMSKNNKGFPELVRKAISGLDYWNHEEKQDQRKFFALENSYFMQIARIEGLID